MENNTLKNYNIAILSISFMLVFTGFNTMSGIQVIQERKILHRTPLSLGHDIQVRHRPQ